jgi:flavin reductase
VTDKAEFLEAMSRFAAAVTLITTGKDDLRYGLTATAVCSLSIDPPSLIACVNQRATGHDTILREECFAVNLLGPQHAALAKRFAGEGGAQGSERFWGSNWLRLSTGAPILADSPAAIDCVLAQKLDGYSHTILVGLVKAVRIPGDVDPHCLLWHGRKFTMTVKN